MREQREDERVRELAKWRGISVNWRAIQSFLAIDVYPS